MKKIALLLVFTLLAAKIFAQDKIKSFEIELNAGAFITRGVEVSVDFNLGAVIPAVNGVNLHGRFLLVTNNLLSLMGPSGRYTVDSGFGFAGGIRFFFGETGINGFYLGVLTSYADVNTKYASPSYGSGSVTVRFWLISGEIGYRFILSDFFSLTLGLGAGTDYYYQSSGTMTGIVGVYSTGDGVHGLFVPEFTIGLDFVF